MYNGNIGIGTATPVGKFDIFTGISGFSFNIPNQDFGSISFGNVSSTTQIPAMIGKSLNSTGMYLIAASTESNALPDMHLTVRRNDNTDFSGLTSTAFRFSRFATSLVDILRNGNVGIGTTTPVGKLDISTGSSTTYNMSGQGSGIISFGNPGNISQPSIISKTTTDNASGLILFAGTSDISNVADMRFDVRKNDSNDFTTLTTTAFRFTRAGITLVNILRNGNFGIGTANPGSKLTVKGTIHATEVKVTADVPADYVFEKYYLGQSSLKPDYTMLTLSEVQKFTEENHHLPNVPSAKEIKENGLHLGEMSNILLQKIEELTLYSIEQQKTIEKLEKENEAFKTLSERLSKIENQLKNQN